MIIKSQGRDTIYILENFVVEALLIAFYINQENVRKRMFSSLVTTWLLADGFRDFEKYKCLKFPASVQQQTAGSPVLII